MGLSATSETLSYLTDAAHVLRSTAPTVSAHLMSQHRDLLFVQGIEQSDVQRQHVCGACGHILLASADDAIRIEGWRCHRKVSARKGKGTGTGQGKGMVARRPPAGKTSCKLISCGHCFKSTRVRLGHPPPVSRTRTALPKSQLQPELLPPMTGDGVSLTSLTSKKPTASLSSKKRAKNRKAGLQALLAGQQKGSASSLNLADFMKK